MTWSGRVGDHRLQMRFFPGHAPLCFAGMGDSVGLEAVVRHGIRVHAASFRSVVAPHVDIWTVSRFGHGRMSHRFERLYQWRCSALTRKFWDYLKFDPKSTLLSNQTVFRNPELESGIYFMTKLSSLSNVFPESFGLHSLSIINHLGARSWAKVVL